MTKKDYEMIAECLKTAAVTKGDARAVAIILGHAIAMREPTFDYEQFMKACGFRETVA